MSNMQSQKTSESAVRASLVACRFGEGLFFLLILVYLTGGVFLLPASWFSFFDAHPKVHRKLLAVVAGSAAFLGIALFEWAFKNEQIRSRSILVRMVDSWKSSGGIWVLGLFLMFGTWWTASCWLRHAALRTSFDMAIFTQAVWNTTQGDGFYSSIKGGISLLGDHFAPLLAVFALPYKLWPEPECLLALQAFSAAASMFPIFRIVRTSGRSSAWAVLYAILFALYLPVRNAVRFDFHPEVAAMPLFFWAFAFLQEKRPWPASMFLMLSLLAKENVAIVAFMFGIYACLKRDKSWGFGVFWALFSIVYFLGVVRFVIPALSGQPYAYLDGNFLEWFRAGWRPLAQHLIRASTAEYLFKIFAPLAFTSFLDPGAFLLTLPALAQNLLSRNEMTRSIFFQYTATLTPFVFISSILAGAKMRWRHRYWAYGLLLASVLMSGVTEVYPMRRHWIGVNAHTKTAREIFRSLPAGGSLRTHEFLASQAANRRELHIYENHHPREGGSLKARTAEYVVLDQSMMGDILNNAAVRMKKIADELLTAPLSLKISHLRKRIAQFEMEGDVEMVSAAAAELVKWAGPNSPEAEKLASGGYPTGKAALIAQGYAIITEADGLTMLRRQDPLKAFSRLRRTA